MSATTELLQEGRYRIDATLAETSESSVFLGYDTVRDTKVVVKEIVVRMNKVTTLAQQENIKLNFVNQAKTLASVKHDAIVHVEDYFSEIGKQYLVLESVEGDDLETAVKASKRGFALKEVAAWADQILDALEYLHALEPPLIHKFVRPRNIRQLADGKVKLLAHGMHSGDGSISTSIAPEGDDASVLNYSALEIIWDGLDAASQKVIASGYDEQSEKILKSPPDGRSDVYSVGATLYFLLTAEVPVDPLERSIEMLDGKADPLANVRDLNSDIPEPVAEAIMKSLAIKREDRFESATAMRRALRAAVIRSEEGEDAEERELAEAAEALKRAEQARQEQVRKLVEQKARELEEQKARELEEEKRRADELLQQKLREVEELRLAAEQRAAEADRLLKEKAELAAAEAAIHTSQPAAAEPEAEVFEENLLELTVEPNLAAAAEEAELVALDELDVPEAEEPAAEPAAAVEEPKAEAEPEAKAAFAKAATASYAMDADVSAFSYEETRSGSKMPLIAGAAAVLLLVAIGGWMMLGSGSSEPQPAAQQPSSSAPSQTAPVESAEQPAPTETQPGQTAITEPAPEQPAASTEPSQARTAAKPTPAKAAKPNAEAAKTPEKKKVTVDDLINDN